MQKEAFANKGSPTRKAFPTGIEDIHSSVKCRVEIVEKGTFIMGSPIFSKKTDAHFLALFQMFFF
jgi:hypothetical protein